MSPPYELRASPLHYAWRFLICAAFVAAAVLILLQPAARRDAMAWVVALPGVVFFGLGAFLMGARLVNNRPVLVADELGIQAPGMWGGTIPWSEINELAVRTSVNQVFLEIRLAHPERWSSTLRRRLAGMNRALGYRGDLFVPLSASKQPRDEVLQELLRRWKEMRPRH